MAKNTEHLGLYEKESTDGNDTFNVQSMMNDNWDKIDQFAKDTDDKILNLGTTSNSSNAYSVSAPDGFTLKDNQLLIVKFNATSTGEISLNVGSIGAKPVKDYFGNAVTNVSANLPAILSYESESDSFILSGKGGDGDALDTDIRQGKKATTREGLITGVLPVQATAAQEVIPGTSDIVKPAGIYDGDITIKGIQPSDIGGRKFASGGHDRSDSSLGSSFTVSSLTFTPSIIYVFCRFTGSNHNWRYSLYNILIPMRNNDDDAVNQFNFGYSGSSAMNTNTTEYIKDISPTGFTYSSGSSSYGIYEYHWFAIE